MQTKSIHCAILIPLTTHRGMVKVRERERGGGKSRGRQTVTSQVQEFTSEREASRLNTVFSLRQYPAHDKPLLVPSLSLLQDFLVLDFLALTSGLPYP